MGQAGYAAGVIKWQVNRKARCGKKRRAGLLIRREAR
jgi:hypothetical protein